MRPFAPPTQTAFYAPVEAAPARVRIRWLAGALALALVVLSGRAVQLAFAGDPLERTARPAVERVQRADIVDRNGALLATTVRAYALTAKPDRVWDARETAAALVRLFPDMDRAATQRRLADRSRDLIYLKRGLTLAERERALALGLAGVSFETEERRAYPNGPLAGHLIGYTDRDLKPLAGIERGLDSVIRSADAPVQLSLDIRIQHAAEAELAAAAQVSRARGGAAVVLDGRTGEVLALASYPALDPNRPSEGSAAAQHNWASGERYETGSTIKAFTVASALDLQLTNTGETFDLASPFSVGGQGIVDHERVPAPSGLRELIAYSSNKGAAMLALRVGRQRQHAYLERLGLLSATQLQIAENAPPIAPGAGGRLDVATLGFGYGLAVSPAALAGAYTVFANNGARAPLTLLARRSGDPVQRTQVFSESATRTTLSLLRAVVRQGTGRAADVPGLAIAGKTGTTEKLQGATYNEDRMVSSFAAIFPAFEPRYVIVLALDEPARTAATGGLATGGAVAARPVGRIAARIAPMLGLRVEPRPDDAERR